MKLYKNLVLTIILSFASLNIVNGLNKGLFQDLPIRCLTCSDEDSCKETEPKYHTCELNTDTCLTIFNENDIVIKRGCYSANKISCDDKKNSCYECKSNDCNIAKSKTEFIKCYDCSTFDNPECVNVVEKSNVPIIECRESCMSTLIYVDDRNLTYEAVRTCLDDKEKEDQKTCDDEKFCKSCKEDKCNGGLYPADRLECIHCSKEECQRPTKSRTCANIQENDKCIIQFDDKGVAIEYGCLSDLPKEVINDMLINNTLYMCDDKNCNVYENIPKETICTACTSGKTRECITDINNDIIQTNTCNKPPNTNCYTKFNSSTGLIERGCWSDLVNREEKAACLDKNNENCKLCSGDSCNKDIMPKDRHSCMVCDSTNDENCHDKPEKDELCFNYIKDDICVSKYIDGKTKRGCSADIESCKDLDNKSCKLCLGKNCNKQNLKSILRDDKNIGIWQDLPLKCKLCKSETECASSEKITTEVCKNNNDECVTIFNKNDKVEYRGCSSILSETNDRAKKIYCDTTPELCPLCKSNECNIANSKKEYVKCHYCGWPDSTSCNADIKEQNKFPTRECHKSCMTAAYKKFEDPADIVYNVVRTCLDDKEPQQQNDCKSNNDEYCKSCDGDNCNSKILFENWANCFTCENSEQCKGPLSKQCESYQKIERCYYLFNNDKEAIKGGCLSDISKDIIRGWISDNKISFCDGSDCNKNLPTDQKCVKCNSKEDEKCATEPGSYKEKLETCSIPNSNCYMKLEDGANIRGCMSSLKLEILECVYDVNCHYCNGEECNNMVFPPNRRKCYVCNSADNKDCHEKPSTTKICPVYSEDQKCVSKYTEDGNTERGCSNQLTCNEKDEKKCQICDKENCNTVDLKSLNSSAMIVANTILIVFLALLRNYLS
ncbi:uncharacterized protein LOC129615760 [Condylostylus longicornis]|uniref:uncharacterized protein LOC129615760 n=1 Tax=Condylostylus longicornis TaxID=2530218 RepID=UPI00244E1A13|nr:uncharacterized protein LOC129615760 [Condylostylus longicornis]